MSASIELQAIEKTPCASRQVANGIVESHVVPGDHPILLVIYIPGQHRAIMPLTRAGASAIIDVLAKAELEVGE